MFLDRLFLANVSDDHIWSTFYRLRGFEAPPFDATEGHPLVAEGLTLLAQRNWTALVELYESQTPDGRHHWIDGMGALHPMSTPLPEAPKDAVAHTIAGGVLVGKAWRARGFSDEHHVSEAQQDAYIRILGEAQWALKRAASLKPGDVVTISFLIRCGLGLGMDGDTIYGFEDQLLAALEPSLLADNTMLQCYARKWYGSHEAMWDWAEGRAGQESDRAPAWLALLARAEIEHWIYECKMSRDADSFGSYQATTRTTAFRDRSLDLQTRFLNGVSRAAQPLDPAQAHYAHNAFGTYFHLFGPTEALPPHLEAIGDKPALIPWVHTGIEDDTIGFLNAVRRKAGMKAILQKN